MWYCGGSRITYKYL